MSKFALSSQSLIYQESISTMVSSTETCFKSEFPPILDLVLHLPRNSPRTTHVSQGRERGFVHQRELVKIKDY